MIRFGAPGFLLAGALLALIPLALHMLARTPPERRPLPTARFLTPDRRTRLRLRRPTDPVLLALRMALLLVLGAAFARPQWVAPREGLGVIILLDAGAGMAGAWDQAVATTAERLGGLRARSVLVVFDSAARVLPGPEPAALDSLRRAGPGDAPSSYLAALRGLRAAAGAIPVDSARAVLVTRPRWEAWSPAFPAARAAAWPARLELVEIGTGAGRADPAADAAVAAVEPARPAAIAVGGPAEASLRPYVLAALGALGVEVDGTGDAVAGPRLLLPARSGEGLRFLSGTARQAAVPSAWENEAAPAPPAVSRLVLAGRESLDGWRPLPGRPADGPRILAVWQDGRPAAAVRDDGACSVYLAAEPVAPAAAADPAFPRLLASLIGGCSGTADGEGGTGHPEPAPADRVLAAVGLDAGARSVLAGDAALPALARTTSFEGPPGRPLARWLLALALLIAGAEATLAYLRRRRA